MERSRPRRSSACAAIEAEEDVKNPGSNPETMGAARSSAADLDQLLEVVAALTEVMRRENAFLRGGMPAALSELGDSKDRLTRRLIELGRLAGMPSLADDREQHVLQRHLATSGAALKALTSENMRLLEGAMSASRRRIESVMQAIRAHEGTQLGNRRAAPDFRISTVKFEV
jgi:hypothetical protein